MLLIFIGLLSSFLTSYHGGHSAEYHFSVENDRLLMHFSIDRHELTHYTLDEECDLNAMLAFCTAQYVLRHSSVHVNGTEVKLAFSASKVEKGHLLILFEGSLPDTALQEIKIWNECFLAFEPKFKNRVVVGIGAVDAAYRLDGGRKEVEVIFN